MYVCVYIYIYIYNVICVYISLDECVCVCVCVCVRAISQMSRVFANGPGDQGSIPKTQKWYLILPCLALSIIR